VSDLRSFELVAEIGVVLLMFSVGLEISLRDLARVRWVAVVGGPLAIAASIGLGLGLGALLGWPVLQGAVVGMVLSVSSTMVATRLLMERGELHARHGRIILGTALVEDLAVVVMIVAMPRLGAAGDGRLLAVGLALAAAAGALVPVTYLAARVVPALLARVARTRSQELFLLVALAIAAGTAALSHAAGLSLALGAFLAGLVISESDYAHETLARLLPLRDAFVAVFFVTIGALVNPPAIVGHAGLLAGLVGLVVIGKLAVRLAVVPLFGYPLATALLVGVGLAQIGEFSFVLIQVARRAGHVGEDVYQATLAASLLTILANAALVRVVPGWVAARRLRGRPEAAPTPPGPAAGHVVIAGFGRVGSVSAEALETFRTSYVAIELDPDIVRGLRARAVPCLYGDASQPGILRAAGADRAALVVVALPEIQAAHLAVRQARAMTGAPILARAHHAADRDRLLAAGATEVIQPEVEAASTLIRRALQHLALPRERVLAYLDRFRGAMEMVPAIRVGGALPEVREVILPAGQLAGQSLRDARIRERVGVTVLGVTRSDGELVLHPLPDTILRAGDRVMVFGLPEQIGAFEREAATEG
jgi:CPA2 family monovalent cation:H+ antiporter-2